VRADLRRAYSTALGALRAARRPNPTAGHGPILDDHDRDPADAETILVIGQWRYACSGWLTTGDAHLAALARRRRPLTPHPRPSGVTAP
jgi:hypothetical protein